MACISHRLRHTVTRPFIRVQLKTPDYKNRGLRKWRINVLFMRAVRILCKLRINGPTVDGSTSPLSLFSNFSVSLGVTTLGVSKL